jgi:O-antigen/teichoic acid export membrane protein
MAEMSSLSQQGSELGSSDRSGQPANDRFDPNTSGSLATRVARGSIVNGSFLAAINILGLIKGLVAASLLGAAAYGVWGLIAATSSFVLALGAVGIDDKYIQQDHGNQETAFQVAFTLQCGIVAILGLGILGAMPLFSLIYGRPEIIAPGMTLAVVMPAAALQAPLWVFWRRMDFVRQRSLQIWDPVVSLLAVVVLAAVGFGVWALVLGTIAGVYAASFVAIRASPYRLRLRFEPGAMREYASFSWPLFLGAASALAVTLVPALVASRVAGLAAVGAITLANVIVQFANRVDEVITQVLYPAICAIKDQRELLFAAFSKSNRLALLWALPCGAAGALFAGDFVHYVLGQKWRVAVTLIQVLAVTAAVNQVGFNWSAFYRALARTKPIAVVNVVLLIGVLGIAVPLLIAYGLDGYAAGMAAATGVMIVVRLFFLIRIFPALDVVSHVARAFAPTVLAVCVVLGSRVAFGLDHSLGPVIAQSVLFIVIVLVATLRSERELFREVVGYLRGAAPSLVG